MAYAEIQHINGRDKMQPDLQPDAVESSAERAIRLWHDLGLIWKGIGGAFAAGLLAWQLGAFAVPGRIAALEKSDTGMQADVKQLAGDVGVLKIDMAAVKTDVAAIKGDLRSFKDEVKAEFRAGIAEMKLAVSGAPAQVAAVQQSNAQAATTPRVAAVARRKTARLGHKPKPSLWSTITTGN
jgi:hypothetical protein